MGHKLIRKRITIYSHSVIESYISIASRLRDVPPFPHLPKTVGSRATELNSEVNSTCPPLLLYPSKTVLIEQEVEHAHRDHAALIAQGLHHVAHEHDFLEAVIDAEQGGLLLGGLLGSPHLQRRLDVDAVGAPVGDKVDLELFANVPALIADASL